MPGCSRITFGPTVGGHESDRLLENAMTRLGMSARGWTRILRVSRTIADLEGSKDIASPHIAEAIRYRRLDV